jgi:hypothetical protein
MKIELLKIKELFESDNPDDHELAIVISKRYIQVNQPAEKELEVGKKYMITFMSQLEKTVKQYEEIFVDRVTSNEMELFTWINPDFGTMRLAKWRILDISPA